MGFLPIYSCMYVSQVPANYVVDRGSVSLSLCLPQPSPCRLPLAVPRTTLCLTSPSPCTVADESRIAVSCDAAIFDVDGTCGERKKNEQSLQVSVSDGLPPLRESCIKRTQKPCFHSYSTLFVSLSWKSGSSAFKRTQHIQSARDVKKLLC